MIEVKLFDLLEQSLDTPSREAARPEPEAELRWAEESGAGLSTQEAARRLAKEGPNQLQARKRASAPALFLAQYKDIMTLILLACTVISLFMGEYVEAAAIAVIVLMNGVLGFIQEYRTERTLEALSRMASPTARAVRDGQTLRIPASELVPGDLVLLEAGDRIPADGALLEAAALECDESMLTGESLPVKKLAGRSREI